MVEGGGFARSELLAEPGWLADVSDDASVRLVDCSPSDRYYWPHIPGAVRLPSPYALKDPADPLHVLGPEAFAEMMGGLGVGDDTTVVAYDCHNGMFAAKLWWVLTYYGHRDARLLDGGLQAWLAEQRGITGKEATPEPAHFTPRRDEAVFCDLEGLRERLGRPDVRVLDARSDGEWDGLNPWGNRRVGHIPGAVHLEWLRFLREDAAGRLRPPGEIARVLEAAGLSPGHEVVTYCQAGYRASLAAFVLTLMGYARVRCFDGSMKEWANREDTPLEA